LIDSLLSYFRLPLSWQAGPLESVRIPTDRDTKRQKPFAFILFRFAESISYAVELFRDVRLFGRTLRLQNKATGAGMNNGSSQNFYPRQDYNNGQSHHHRSYSAPQLPMAMNNHPSNIGLGQQMPPMFMANGFPNAPLAPMANPFPMMQPFSQPFMPPPTAPLMASAESPFRPNHDYGRHYSEHNEESGSRSRSHRPYQRSERNKDYRDRPYDRRDHDDRGRRRSDDRSSRYHDSSGRRR
jgi:RNA recognition motif-containing protein